MKKKIQQLSILLIVLIFSSCLKEDHSIRLKNNFGEQVNNVKMGSADIGNVAVNTTSDYKTIHTGNFSITGTTSSGKELVGSGSLSGKGKHKWTVTLTRTGSISVAED